MSTGGPPNINPFNSKSTPRNNPATGTGPEANASQFRGHMKYAKGATEEVLGRLTSSTSLSSSAANDKEQGIEEMRAAKAASDTHASQEYDAKPKSKLEKEGRMESKIGSGVGCGGLEERGGEKLRAAGEKLE